MGRKETRERNDTTGLTNWAEINRIQELWNEDTIEASDTEWLMEELEQAWNAWEKMKDFVTVIENRYRSSEAYRIMVMMNELESES